MLRKCFAVLCICFIFISSALASEENITRAEFIAMINDTLELDGFMEINFNDVSKEDQYYQDIAIGVENNYIAGFSDNTIRPNKYITKEEAGSLLSRFLKDKEQEENLRIKDKLQISPWCSEAMGKVVNNKIMTLANNQLLPKSHITKMKAKEYINNLKNHLEKKLTLSNPGEYNFEGNTYNTISINSNDISLINCYIDELVITDKVERFTITTSEAKRLVIYFDENILEICNLKVGTTLKISLSKDKVFINSDDDNSLIICEKKGNYLIDFDGIFSTINIKTADSRFKLSSYSYIDKLKVIKDTKDNIFECKLNSKVNNLIVDEKSIYKGLGNIIFAKGDALSECVFERLPKNLRPVNKKVSKSIKKYKVDFYDGEGNLIKSEFVREGQNANPPTLEDFENQIFISWESSYNDIRENISVYPIYEEFDRVKELKVSEIGTRGSLKDSNNTYKIDNNSMFGFKTLVVKKDRLPNNLSKYSKFEVMINDLTIELEENVFDSSYLMANFNHFINEEVIENSLLKAYLE